MLMQRATKKSGNSYRGVVHAVDPLHDEMAQGRGGEELATPHSRGSQEEQHPRGTRGTGGGEAVLLIQQLYVDERRNEMADPMARYQFD